MAQSVASLRSPWNPMYCGGSELRPEHLLIAKLVLLYAATNVVSLLPPALIPFIPEFGTLGTLLPVVVLRIIYIAATVCVLFNIRVRTATLIGGACILTSVLWSRPAFQNNHLFAGCMLFMLGLTPKSGNLRLVRWQVALVYLGAFLSKVADPDWRNGAFVTYWSHWPQGGFVQPLYFWLANALPNNVVALGMSWSAILAEAFLAVGFLLKGMYPLSIWVGLLLHIGLFVLTDRSFGIFFFTMTTTYLAFVEWPARVNVLYDGDCGICEKTRDFFQRLDFEQRFHWTPFQFARSLFGISEDALGSRMHIEANGNIYSGFAAFQRLVLYNPVSYFVWLLFMKLPQPAGLHFRKYLAVGLLVLFSPIFAPIGGWAYDLFARNRYKMPGKTVCAVPPSAGRAPEEN